jgi:hypothetical protein
MPPELASLITELGTGVRSGIVMKDFFETGAKATGGTKLDMFAQEFKAGYLQA